VAVHEGAAPEAPPEAATLDIPTHPTPEPPRPESDTPKLGRGAVAAPVHPFARAMGPRTPHARSAPPKAEPAGRRPII